MKYAVITDVHSNVFALEAALKKIDELRPDKIICLGDIVGNGFYPEETVSLLRARKDVTCVKGNHDIFVTMDLKNFSRSDTRLKNFRWQQVFERTSDDVAFFGRRVFRRRVSLSDDAQR